MVGGIYTVAISKSKVFKPNSPKFFTEILYSSLLCPLKQKQTYVIIWLQTGLMSSDKKKIRNKCVHLIIQLSLLNYDNVPIIGFFFSSC